MTPGEKEHCEEQGRPGDSRVRHGHYGPFSGAGASLDLWQMQLQLSLGILGREGALPQRHLRMPLSEVGTGCYISTGEHLASRWSLGPYSAFSSFDGKQGSEESSRNTQMRGMVWHR